MHIAAVNVLRYNKILKDGPYMKLIIDHNNTKEIFCIIENDIAIDIFTGAEYQILQREDSGKLTIEQSNRIVLNKPYASTVKIIDLTILPDDVLSVLKLNAQRTYKIYQGEEKSHALSR